MSPEFSNDDSLMVTGEQLTSYINKLEAEGKHTHAFFTDMGRLLADRIDDRTVPLGYFMATELLIYDCEKGVSGFTGEPMPDSLSGLPDISYSLFRREAQNYAHNAFGDEFGEQVSLVYADMIAQQQAAQ